MGVIVLLFDETHATTSSAQVRRTEMSEGPWAEISLKGSEHWLRTAWVNLIEPILDEAAPVLVGVFEHNLRRAHLLLRAFGTAGASTWDPESFGCSAIQTAYRVKDSYPQAFDRLIDGAR